MAEVKLKADGTPRKTRATKAKKTEEIKTETTTQSQVLEKFVFMDKVLDILDIGLKTESNIVLYGPGGHGKSELALEFFYEKGINPYVITMGSGMTPDRLFGGVDLIKLNNEGKIEYLLDNSFMNHEYVIFEEMMDAPDYVIEQLKDILSSGYFRNGTQVYPIKTRFIVANTNKTRTEFSKNDSLKALMERFPLELNVIWPSYNEISYNTLLEKRFGAGRVDPIIPFILNEYVKASITISPRIAINAYSVYETCGPDSLLYIAEFSKKPEIITNSLIKFKATLEFKESGMNLLETVKAARNVKVDSTNIDQMKGFVQTYKDIKKQFKSVQSLSVTDSMAVDHATVIKEANNYIESFKSTYSTYVEEISRLEQ